MDVDAQRRGGWGQMDRGPQLPERQGAVADGVLGRRLHLAEGLVVAFGDEDGVVAEALAAAARREGQDPWTSPCTSAARPSGQASASAQVNQAE